MDSEAGERSDDRPPTLEDVARHAGVSRQTVSNVLSAPDRVRPETRARVTASVLALGYQPNRLAQAFRSGTSRMIAYRLKPHDPHALLSLHDRFLHALSTASQTADRQVLLFTATDVRDEVEICSRMFRGGAMDAVVIYDVEDDDSRPEALLARHVPFVAFGHTREGIDRYTWVDVDNEAGSARAVEQFVNLGHRRIGFVGMPKGHTIGDRRAEGWRQAIRGHGLSDDLIMQGTDSVAGGIDMTAALLSRGDPPTAVVAANDTLAVGVLRCSWSSSTGPRGTLAVIGFDDTPTAAALELSSIRQPIEDIGQTIMAKLMATDQPPSRVLKTPWLVARASSAHPPPH
jgi:DNA-binding LacI/PurR family transcriptional regulator